MMQKSQTWKPETMHMEKRIAWQIMMGKKLQRRAKGFSRRT